MRIRTVMALSAVIATLGGCGSPAHHRTPSHRQTHTAGLTAVDGETAVFRAKVTPVLCRYAGELGEAQVQIVKASDDAQGPLNGSAPEAAQSEYARAMVYLAEVMHGALGDFRSIKAPSHLQHEYASYLESLTELTRQADRVAGYARARNFSAIAATEDVDVAAGQGVFRSAGITSCQPPTS